MSGNTSKPYKSLGIFLIKNKSINFVLVESYHNTLIYLINMKKNIKKIFTANISSVIQKPVSSFNLYELFSIKVYMPTVQFAKVPNKSSISNTVLAALLLL